MIVKLLNSFIRRSFAAANLSQSSIAVDQHTTIHYWAPTNPDPERPSLALIHGFGPTATWQWRHQVGPLSRHFNLVIPDLIFFGGSTTSSPNRSDLFQAESICKLLETIVPSGSYFDVVGTSYGGFVAYHMAKMCGVERIRRVVIASSDLMKGEEDDRMLVERAGGVQSTVELMMPRSTKMVRKLVGLAVYRQPLFVPEFILKDVLKNIYSDNVKEKTELIEGLYLGSKEFQLTPLPQDVLIVWGEHDRIFPLNKAYEIQKRLGENVRIEIVKNTGHVPNAEHPQRFNEILLSFLLNDTKL